MREWLAEYWEILALWVCGLTMIYFATIYDLRAFSGWAVATMLVVLRLSENIDAYYYPKLPKKD